MTHSYRCKKCGATVWCNGMGDMLYACVLKICLKCFNKKVKRAGSIDKVMEQEGVKRTNHEYEGMQFQMLWSKEDFEQLENLGEDLGFDFKMPHIYVTRAGYKDNCAKYIEEQKEAGKRIILLTLEDILLGRFVDKCRVAGLPLKNNITKDIVQMKLYGW